MSRLEQRPSNVECLKRPKSGHEPAVSGRSAIGALTRKSASTVLVQYIIENCNRIAANRLSDFHELGNIEQAFVVFVFANKGLRPTKPLCQHGLRDLCLASRHYKRTNDPTVKVVAR
jgi:hypothetical protein